MKKSAAKKTARKTAKKTVKKSVRKPSKHPVRKTAKKPALKLSRRELEHFKTRLKAEKNRVLEEMDGLQQDNLKTSISDAAGENSRYTFHLGDVASLSYGREFSMGLAERQQKYLEEIDEALERINEGTYGICKVTGELIPAERLEEVPVAKYSVKGKEILERRRRQGG